LHPRATALETSLTQSGLAGQYALDGAILHTLKRYDAGVRAYLSAPRPEWVRDRIPCWDQENPDAPQLYDYGGPQDGPIVLAVPSFINPATIFDLTQQRSLLGHLRAAGVRCYLLDWGDCATAPDVDAMIDGPLARALTTLHARHGRPISLIGYCMGGTVSVAAAVRYPAYIQGLAALATPWNCHETSHGGQSVTEIIHAACRHNDPVSLAILDRLFFAIDPVRIIEKYGTFANTAQDEATVARFVALEDWLNAGTPLSAALARTTIGQWYGPMGNPAHGKWTVGGQTIDPKHLSCPVLVIAAQKDQVVPLPSALALAGACTTAQVHEVPSGHIGLIMGASAPRHTYATLTKWLFQQKTL